ncbi:hypothetical protein [Pseudomonas koreensis]|jgi:hypothetical protein|uniref:hypothetical protein n=1 Tax=Pseudomonas koreensis TaxID=198620 RepID=UPI001B318E8E|nr:hypothetical protein [Pseudomonas koreensis]MBP3996454.1 hypothetical protein [Pseudomonas koreensis]
MAFVYLKDTNGEVLVLNTDLISHVTSKIKGTFDHGAQVYLKHSIDGHRNFIQVADEDARQLLKTILN